MTQTARTGTATRLMDAAALRRTVTRLAHQLREHHPGLGGVVLAAIREGGVMVAALLAAELAAQGDPAPPVLALDIAGYRDDRPRGERRGGAATAIAVLGGGAVPAVDGATVVLVDDVLHTGRSLRAALDLVADAGRPAAVEPLVLFDRGRRELPVRATYVGRNLPVAAGDWVEVAFDPGDEAGTGAWLVGRR